MLSGTSPITEERWEAARSLSESKGFPAAHAEAVLDGPLDDLLARVEAINMRNKMTRVTEAAALLGTTPAPRVTVSRALELYWDLTASDHRKKSPVQLRAARNPVIRAFKNFTSVVGDKPIAEISREDMLTFREWLAAKITSGACQPATANKDLIHFTKVLRKVNDLKRLGLTLELDGLSFREDDKKKRPPFSREWIETKLLAPGVLDGLNTEARCILLGMVNTGYRPSEGANLLPERIKLDGEVPMIEIRPDDRQVKTERAKRDIPLAGVSLEAMRQCRNGFPRYRDTPTLSATLNKFLRSNGLLQSSDHTVYSLRHAFEDRLLDAGVDERIRRDFMGHRLSREEYGKGASPKKALECIQLIAL
jgi:integrase